MSWLGPTVPSVAWLHLSPGGGERYGDLIVVALALAEVPDLDAAAVALWKVVWCLQEESPYAVWTDAEVARVGLKPEAWTWFPSAVDASGDVDWLVGRGREVVEAQRTLAKPLNPWRASVEGHVGEPLEALSFATLANLKALMASRWNDTVAVFVQDRHAYLVGWSTSA